MHDGPKFKHGDLVEGHYVFLEEFYWWEDLEGSFFHIGVVIATEYDSYFFDDYLYTVLCLDQVKRFFVESEMIKII